MAAMAAAQTMVSIDFPDGCIVSYDRVRRSMILTMSNGGVMSAGATIPARPNPPVKSTVQVVNADGTVTEKSVVVEEVLEPVSRSAIVNKLGFKKAPIIGSDIWNRRYIHLDEKTLSYHVDENSAPKGVIHLSPGCEVGIVQEHERARKDRQEGGHNPGVGALMTMQIGQMMDPRSTPIGKPNCVELHVPANLGNTISSVMGASAMSLAMSGARDIKKNAARTYYFSFDSLDEAEEFAGALQNNIKCLVNQNKIGDKDLRGAGDAMRGGNFSQLNDVMAMAHAVQKNQALMTSPDTSLEWYKVSLNTSLPLDVVYERLMIFYDTLASFNIHPSY